MKRERRFSWVFFWQELWEDEVGQWLMFNPFDSYEVRKLLCHLYFKRKIVSYTYSKNNTVVCYYLVIDFSMWNHDNSGLWGFLKNFLLTVTRLLSQRWRQSTGLEVRKPTGYLGPHDYKLGIRHQASDIVKTNKKKNKNRALSLEESQSRTGWMDPHIELPTGNESSCLWQNLKFSPTSASHISSHRIFWAWFCSPVNKP